MSQNRKNGQTTQTSNVKTARLLWVNKKITSVSMDHLHEACGSVDFSSNFSLFYGCVWYNFVAVDDVQIIFTIRCFGRVSLIRGFTP